MILIRVVRIFQFSTYHSRGVIFDPQFHDLTPCDSKFIEFEVVYYCSQFNAH